jgi:hypothetical protein
VAAGSLPPADAFLRLTQPQLQAPSHFQQEPSQVPQPRLPARSQRPQSLVPSKPDRREQAAQLLLAAPGLPQRQWELPAV